MANIFRHYIISIKSKLRSNYNGQIMTFIEDLITVNSNSTIVFSLIDNLLHNLHPYRPSNPYKLSSFHLGRCLLIPRYCLNIRNEIILTTALSICSQDLGLYPRQTSKEELHRDAPKESQPLSASFSVSVGQGRRCLRSSRAKGQRSDGGSVCSLSGSNGLWRMAEGPRG